MLTPAGVWPSFSSLPSINGCRPDKAMIHVHLSRILARGRESFSCTPWAWLIEGDKARLRSGANNLSQLLC